MERDEGQLKVTSLSPPPELIGAAPGSRVLVIQADDALFLLEEEALAAARVERSAIDLRDHPRSRRIATAVSGAWSINPVKKTLAFCDEERPGTLLLEDGVKPSPFTVGGLGGIVEGMVVDDGDIAPLWTSRADGDPDLDVLDLCCVEVRKGTIVADRILSTVGRLQVVWSASARSFFALDFDAERLWRVSTNGQKTEVVLPARGGDLSPSQLTVHPQGSPLGVQLEGGLPERWRLLQAVPEEKTIRWDPPMEREGETCEPIAWHPHLQRFACERRTGKRSTLSFFDSRGTCLHEQSLPDDWVVSDVAWSGDGRFVHMAFEAGIASLEMK